MALSDERLKDLILTEARRIGADGCTCDECVVIARIIATEAAEDMRERAVELGVSLRDEQRMAGRQNFAAAIEHYRLAIERLENEMPGGEQ